jgi:hypothetical protein
MRPSCLTLVPGLLTALTAPAAPPPAPAVDNVRAVGEVVADKGTEEGEPGGQARP